ncbi:MAG TPA: hypothetical protein VJR58_04940 [Vineibacter sp.]|nr:hypothetical protein [Vineibacter sp.]
MTDIVETGGPGRHDRTTAVVRHASPPGPTTATEGALVRAVAEARLPGARGRFEDFLPDTEAITQRRHSPFATWLIFTLAALVIASVAWMHLSRIDEVVSAPGLVRIASTTATGESARLEIEARVAGNDVGMITPGQVATIKVQAFDWTRHGTLKGRVVEITPAAAPYFLARITLDKDFLGDDQRRHPLMAGMTATVDLHVGERSILSFFTSGVLRTVGPSLRERN